MSKIVITESQLRNVLDKIVSEQTSGGRSPVIDFNKLPARVEPTNQFNIRDLKTAGFPDSDPFRNMNFGRYYDRKVGGEGQYYYTKKSTPPNPNYILSPQEKTQMGGKLSTTGKYLSGFLGKFSCVTQQGWTEIDDDKDGKVEKIKRGGTNEEIVYYPNGKSKIWRGSPPKPHWEDSTYYCSGKKVIDSFIKNKKMKAYTNTPFVKTTSSLNGGSYIPLFTTDNGSNGRIISDMQQKLIDLGFLGIKKPTGNYGNMTQNAIQQFSTQYNPGAWTNQGSGITKDLYDMLMNTKK